MKRKVNNTIILAYYGAGKSTIASTSDTITELTYNNNHVTVEQLQQALEEFDVILVDPLWMHILIKHGYQFHVVVPSLDCKAEYLQRLAQRRKRRLGSGHSGFVRWMANNWERLIAELKSTPCLSLTELNNGQYLADVIEKFL